ncbi:efflux RND transporter permease subunit [uncultured Aquimonas sp.]|jgi:multidrug efflux pump subunit AcrB|uniref:efflux RND transporter permease subunit n=1 Tax=uncultured Aquimonas sp. TaxID=385483 RepID=UPI000AC88A2C|nr:efflux RND transporter permease subunit [uncultured Aquimonas sp.]
MAESQAMPRMGISGRLAAAFQNNPLTPILAIAGLLLGLIAVLITPREEEPQIDVTMANVFVPFPGAPAEDVENLVSYPLEQVLSEIEGVKHVYSISRPGVAVITVEYTVGVPRADAILRLYNQVYSNADWAPPNLGVGQPLVRPMGIDDVPVMSLTVWTDDPARGGVEVAEVAHTLETELKRVPGTRDVYTIGAPERAVVVELDAQRLASYGIDMNDLAGALQASNVVMQAGERVEDGRQIPVTAGTYLADAQQVAELVIGLREGRPLYLSDVAEIRRGADLPVSYVWHARPEQGQLLAMHPAVTIAIAKKPGANASDITRAIGRRIGELRGSLIPEGVQVDITRDYGKTANDKAIQLIQKLIFATMAVVLLVLFALGWREAVVVGTAVIITLALTLFASWAMGFTINRVSLFALIFSIGILVDDAVVVVENIHRHMARGGKSLLEAIPPAVDEVGSPTILATFTVIAALLPMAFVSGLMGPYMRPIPINASVGMLLSLAVALIVTPWLSLKLLSRHEAAHRVGPGPPELEPSDASNLSGSSGATDEGRGRAQAMVGQGPPYAGTGAKAIGDGHGSGIAARLHGLFERLLRPFLHRERGARRRLWLFAGIVGAVVLSAGLAVVQLVVLKMLPFDNKSEFQVVVDLPEGSTVERTNALLQELALILAQVPEVADMQGYAGTSAPVNFNGLVRQYYLREGANVGDLQVNLVDKSERSRKSHDIARAVRPALQQIAQRYGAALKVVEVPPGPPVMSPLVAEVYGPDAAGARAIALKVAEVFRGTEGLVDIDTTVEAEASREVLVVDRERAARLGISQAQIAQALSAGVSGVDATFLRDGASKYPVPVRLRLPAGEQARLEALLALRIRSADGRLLPLSEVVRVERTGWESAIYHKDLLPVVYVMADEAGALDSPLYGMFSVVSSLNEAADLPWPIEQRFFSAPESTAGFSLKWDGEWQITFETFRDMGIAYAAGMLLIYLLVVAQFRSYAVPLVIMAPIPLTVIGVMPGHALLGAQFTATSMIGMIALAGIIVRNSILLVDFINHEIAHGRPLDEAVIEACAVRAQPIALTALAAMAGAFFILDDPIFNGLAIALIFGILVSTVLTLVVIPLLYYSLLKFQEGRAA